MSVELRANIGFIPGWRPKKDANLGHRSGEKHAVCGLDLECGIRVRRSNFLPRPVAFGVEMAYWLLKASFKQLGWASRCRKARFAKDCGASRGELARDWSFAARIRALGRGLLPGRTVASDTSGPGSDGVSRTGTCRGRDLA